MHVNKWTFVCVFVCVCLSLWRVSECLCMCVCVCLGVGGCFSGPLYLFSFDSLSGAYFPTVDFADRYVNMHKHSIQALYLSVTSLLVSPGMSANTTD